MRSPFKLSALFLTAAIAMGVTGQANALDVGDKGQFATIEKTLKQENQVEVARAKYVLNREDPTRMKVLCIKFTINAAGDAYILMSDNIDDSKANIEMIYGKLKNARASDPHNLGVFPRGVSEQSELAKIIKRGAIYGDGILLHGQSIKKLPSGSEAVVGMTTVMANVSNSNDPTVSNTVSILVTTTNNVTSLDKVVATELKYRSLPTIAK